MRHPQSLAASVRSFGELVRFSHTVFALPFAFLSVILCLNVPVPEGLPLPSFSLVKIIAILLCMIFARSAAMTFNRLADADVDARNPRTAKRHIPAGLISKRQANFFLGMCSAGFIFSTSLFLPNWLPLALAAPLLFFLMGYSLTKRFTWGCHFWLGAALMLAPISAWIAIRGEIILSHPADILPPLVLGTAVFLWVSGFDIIYACQDEKFDRDSKLHSVPAKFGARNALRMAAALHFAMIVVLVLLGCLFSQLSFGPIYFTTVGVIAALLCWEHWLVRPDDLSRVNQAFFNVNAIISFLLFAIGSLDTIWR